MEIVKQVCPQCGTRLKITRVDDSSSMPVTCPVCRNTFLAKFNVPPPLPPIAGGGPQVDSGGRMSHLETKILTKKNVMSCALNCNGAIYQLRPGRNVVGRMSPSSQADIQIMTQDRSMSRRHASIFVKNDKVTITKFEGNDQASLMVDGLRLHAADEVKLLPGSIIVMGNTQMVCNIMA